MKRPIIIIALGVGALVIVLVIIRVVAYNLPPRNQSSSTSPASSLTQSTTTAGTSKLTQQWSQGKCKGQGPIQFTRSPMNFEDIGVILPYGLVVDAHVTPIDHMYFSPKIFRSERDKYPVYAIADGTIVSIQHRGQSVSDSGENGTKSEYRIDVEYTCSFYSYYDLVTSLHPDIAQAAGITNTNRNSHKRVPIKAGQEIGRIGGQTLDWAVYNTDVKLGFIVPEHYDYEPWKIHTDLNSFDYFPADIKTQLMNLVARQAEPRLGKIDYDIDGKLIGNWFRVGTNGYGGTYQHRYWDGHLAIVYDYIDPTQIRFSIGNFNGKAAQFGVKGNTPDPATIGIESGLVKYELQQYDYYNKDTSQSWRSNEGPIANPASRNINEVLGTALLQLIEPRKLKVEVFPGKTASQVSGFTSAAQIYER